jgi:hypothetical protein
LAKLVSIRRNPDHPAALRRSPAGDYKHEGNAESAYSGYRDLLQRF